jgi:RNA polymerase sigma-70 factor (ECF subfamily)
VLRLPAKYKDCVYLHYYEGYKTAEIANMLGVPASTIRNRLRDARGLLKKALGGDAT